MAALNACGLATAPPPQPAQADREPTPPDRVIVQKTIWRDHDRGWVGLVTAEADGGDYNHPARVFVTNDRLNILFGSANKALGRDESGIPASLASAPLGTRERVLYGRGELWNRGWGSTMKRADWLVVPVKTSAASLPGLPETGAAPSVELPAEGGATPASGSPTRHRGVRERLELLEELNADGLITDEEYRDTSASRMMAPEWIQAWRSPWARA